MRRRFLAVAVVVVVAVAAIWFVAARSPETMAGGLLAYLNGEDAKAIEQWNQLLTLNSELPSPVRVFLQNWIAKAKARLPAVPAGRP